MTIFSKNFGGPIASFAPPGYAYGWFICSGSDLNSLVSWLLLLYVLDQWTSLQTTLTSIYKLP